MDLLQPDINLLYADLLRMATIPALSAKGFSVIKKTNRGHVYWYLQLAVGAKRFHQYIGPDTEKNRRHIEALKERWEESQPTLMERKRLVAMLRAAKAPSADTTIGRILEVLEQTGVFNLGAVLVGSHAFAVYQNMLGIRWPLEAAMTQDVDLAKDIIDVGVNLDMDAALSELGFAPTPSFFTGKASPTFMLRNSLITLDVLTPMRGNRNEPVWLKNLKTHAQPVRYLDYLIGDPQQAVIVYGPGVLVNVPSPGRFAFHKLVVSQQRKASEAIKKKIDLAQANCLFQFLLEHLEGEVVTAYHAGRKMGGNFFVQLKKGLAMLPTGREVLQRIESPD